MTLIELTLTVSQKPVVVNLAHVTEMRPASAGTDIWFTVPNGDHTSFGPDRISVSEPYTHIVRCIRATVTGVPNVRRWAALNDGYEPDPLSGWQPMSLSPDLIAEMEAEQAADAAREARMEALEGRR